MMSFFIQETFRQARNWVFDFVGYLHLCNYFD